MRASFILRQCRGFWGKGGPWWAQKNFAENQAQWWMKDGRYHQYHHRPRKMVLGFLAGVAVGYLACANYPPRWMNLEYLKEKRCWREKFEHKDFTTRVINPELINNYDAKNGLLTIRLPEPIREKFNKWGANNKSEDEQQWTSTSKRE